MIQSVFRALDINFRMHAKSFTVDNQATILGGRNIGNEYFDADTDVAFSDLDVLSIGPPVAEVSSQFDSYWNNEFAYPVNILVRQGNEQELAALRDSSVDMSDLTGQSILNNTCLGDCRDERRTTACAKTIACAGARTENWQVRYSHPQLSAMSSPAVSK
jgi:phosphatidylserine/phosphatidylglycerophosphate/cardiolipin synthase-like enzyme